MKKVEVYFLTLFCTFLSFETFAGYGANCDISQMAEVELKGNMEGKMDGSDYILFENGNGVCAANLFNTGDGRFRIETNYGYLNLTQSGNRASECLTNKSLWKIGYTNVSSPMIITGLTGVGSEAGKHLTLGIHRSGDYISPSAKQFGLKVLKCNSH